MIKILSYMYPLAKIKATNVGDSGTFARIFGAIRVDALDSIGSYVPAVTVVVSLILMFKLIRLSYIIMSDEQSAGFGGVRLWDIVRPLVVVFIIHNSVFFVRLLDSGVTTVTNAFVNRINENVKPADLGAEVTAFETGGQNFDLSTRKGVKAAADAASDANGLNARIDSLAARQSDLRDRYNYHKVYGTGKDAAAAELQAELARTEEALKAARDQKKTATEALAEYADCVDELKDPRSVLAVYSQWIYDRFVFIMICITDIILSCFAVFAPLVFAVSLIDKWRDSLMNWVAGYIQVSLWKVTVAVINWVVVNSRTTALAWIRQFNIDSFSSFAADAGVSVSYVNSGAWLVVASIIAIAGTLCLFLAPTITHMILSLGSAPRELQDASKSTFMAPASAGKGAVNLGMRLFGRH